MTRTDRRATALRRGHSRRRAMRRTRAGGWPPSGSQRPTS